MRKSFVIDPQLIQNRRVKITNMNGLFSHVIAVVIS
jgi:hypothetical protein